MSQLSTLMVSRAAFHSRTLLALRNAFAMPASVRGLADCFQGY